MFFLNSGLILQYTILCVYITYLCTLYFEINIGPRFINFVLSGFGLLTIIWHIKNVKQEKSYILTHHDGAETFLKPHLFIMPKQIDNTYIWYLGNNQMWKRKCLSISNQNTVSGKIIYYLGETVHIVWQF